MAATLTIRSSSSFSLPLLNQWTQLKENAPEGLLKIRKLMDRIEREDSTTQCLRYIEEGGAHPLAPAIAIQFHRLGSELQKLLAPKGIPFSLEINMPVSVQTVTDLQAQLKEKEEALSLERIWNEQIAPHLEFEAHPIPSDHAAIRAWLNDPANAAQIEDIIGLDLSGMQLKVLPPEIGHFHGIKELCLCSNKLRDLPESLKNLKNLKSLHLCANRFKAFPEFIGTFEKLKSLAIGSSELDHLPEFLLNLKSLEVLDASRNNLSSLPEWIGELKTLKVLDLENNKLSYLPDSIGQLEELESIDLSFNNLISLPLSMRNLSAEIDIVFDHFSSAFVLEDPTAELPLSTLMHHLNECLNYTCQTPFAHFFQALIRNAPMEEVQVMYDQLPDETKEDLQKELNLRPIPAELATSSSFSPNRFFLTLSAKNALLNARHNSLSDEQLEVFYKAIYRCNEAAPIAARLRSSDLKPLNSSQLQWAKDNAYKHFLRFVDAVELAKAHISSSKRLRTV